MCPSVHVTQRARQFASDFDYKLRHRGSLGPRTKTKHCIRDHSHPERSHSSILEHGHVSRCENAGSAEPQVHLAAYRRPVLRYFYPVFTPFLPQRCSFDPAFTLFLPRFYPSGAAFTPLLPCFYPNSTPFLPRFYPFFTPARRVKSHVYPIFTPFLPCFYPFFTLFLPFHDG